MNLQKTKNTPGSIAITQAMAVLFFIVIPALITFVAPVTTVRLKRESDSVSAAATVHVLLFVPIRTVTVSPLIEIEGVVTSAKRTQTREQRRQGKKSYSFGDGYVVLTGPEQSYSVQSNTTDAPKQAKEIEAFIEDPNAKSLKITAHAGVGLSYVLGGIVTGLAALYCLGAVLAILKWIVGFAFWKDQSPGQTDSIPR